MTDHIILGRMSSLCRVEHSFKAIREKILKLWPLLCPSGGYNHLLDYHQGTLKFKSFIIFVTYGYQNQCKLIGKVDFIRQNDLKNLVQLL